MEKNDNFDLQNIKNVLNNKLKGVSVHNIVDNGDGSVSLVVSGDEGGINGFLSRRELNSFRELPIIDREEASSLFRAREVSSSAPTINRSALTRDDLDLAKVPGSLTASPQELYQRAINYYKTEDVYGSSIDLLSNFAGKGMRNDIDDANIKNFYDNWVVDTGFDVIIDQIFFEFFRSGFVRTFKVVGKYMPKINYISPIPGEKVKKVSEDMASRAVEEHTRYLETAAKKYKWSKDYLPIKYTILNPTLIEVDKSSILVGQELITLKGKGLKEIKELLETPQGDLTEHQKFILKNLPPEFKKAAENEEDIQLNPYLVGAVSYRQQPYELYPLPRGVRAFESMEYKKALRKADYSTLDGITNFILAITIGNDDYPIKSHEQLETVSELFNTSSKAFNVVWDHTLKIQRIEPSDIGDILGQDKYKQVNEDITGAFGVIRALIDGVGNPSKLGAELALKSVREEINYARKQVSRWIYAEYRDVAEAMGFDRYPKVRFDNMVLKDEILIMNVIQGMIDRRIISYRTGHEMLGFDFNTMLSELTNEKDLVVDGTLGILGSPYQKSGGGNTVQDTQKAPKGSPSEGRPKGKISKTPAPSSKPNQPKEDKQEITESSKVVLELLKGMSIDELGSLLEMARAVTIEKLSGDEE